MSENSTRLSDEEPVANYCLKSAIFGAIAGTAVTSLVFYTDDGPTALALPISAAFGAISTGLMGLAGILGEKAEGNIVGAGVLGGFAASTMLTMGSYVGSYNATIRSGNIVDLEDRSALVLTQRNEERQYLSCEDGVCIDLETQKKNSLASIVGESEAKKIEITSRYEAMVSQADSQIAKSSP